MFDYLVQVIFDFKRLGHRQSPDAHNGAFEVGAFHSVQQIRTNHPEIGDEKQLLKLTLLLSRFSEYIAVQTFTNQQHVLGIAPVFMGIVAKISDRNRVKPDPVSKLLIQFLDVYNGRCVISTGHAGAVICIGLHLIGAGGCGIIEQRGGGNNHKSGVLLRKVPKILEGRYGRGQNTRSGMKQHQFSGLFARRQENLGQARFHYGFPALSGIQVVQNRGCRIGIKTADLQVMPCRSGIEFEPGRGNIAKVGRPRITQGGTGEVKSFRGGNGQCKVIVQQAIWQAHRVVANTETGVCFIHNQGVIGFYFDLVFVQVVSTSKPELCRWSGGKDIGQALRQVGRRYAARPPIAIIPGIGDIVINFSFEILIAINLHCIKPAPFCFRREVGQDVGRRSDTLRRSTIVPGEVINNGIVKNTVLLIQLLLPGVVAQILVDSAFVAFAPEFNKISVRHQVFCRRKDRHL